MFQPEVLLVYPSDKTDNYTPPLSLLFIAKVLQNIGLRVSILDMRIHVLDQSFLRRYLFVGISMLTGKSIRYALDFSREIKQFDSKIPIVLGGVHPTLLPEQTLRNELISFIVMGEGEETIRELALCLLNNEDLSRVKGLAFKDKNKTITINSPREFIDLNNIDINLPYELLGVDLKHYLRFPIHTGRGCPYRCGFCYNLSFNKGKYRCKNPVRVVDEIEYCMEKFKTHSFSFAYEDEFFADPRRVCEICELILKRCLKINWGSFGRFDSFDRFDESALKLLKKSGCCYLMFGAESGSQRILDKVIKKGITVAQIVQGVEKLKRYNIPHLISFMSCLPTETEEDLNSTFNLIRKISQNNLLLYINGMPPFIPIPGTPLFNRVETDFGFIPPNSLEEWAMYDVDSLPASKITWQSTKYVKKCQNINKMLLMYPFYNEAINSYKIYKIYTKVHHNYHNSYIFYVIGFLQKWRWENKFYCFFFDLWLYKKIMFCLQISKKCLRNFG